MGSKEIRWVWSMDIVEADQSREFNNSERYALHYSAPSSGLIPSSSARPLRQPPKLAFLALGYVAAAQQERESLFEKVVRRR